jgi:PKD repeat protein
MKNFSILIFFCLCQIALFSQSCGDYSVKLSKTEMFCDGWEGNSIAIKINNVIVYPDVTLTQGQNSYDFFFPVNTDDVVSVLFKRNGSYADCCKYQIFDSNNNLLETRDGDGTGSNGGPENVMGLLACPSGFKCGTYKIEMFDYYGNGWGGSFMQVYINGNPEVIGEFENLSNAWADTEDVSFSVESGDSIDIVWMPDPGVPNSFLYSFLAYKVFNENDSLLAFVETLDTTVLANTYNLLSCPNILPSANFTSTTTSTCSGVVEFFDASSNNPTQWLWDFGDGNTDTVQNPSHNYAASGTYSVSLTVTNSTGGNTISYSNYTTVNLGAVYPVPTSCAPNTQNGSLGFGITNVSIGNLNRSSGDASEGYSDFTCDSTALYVGYSYSIDITHSNPTYHQCAAWIDFNNDGFFDSSTEQIVYNASSLTTSGNVQIPASSVLNVPLRMRVWADYDLGAQLDPCNSPQFGQIEDYTVFILQNTSPPSADFSNNLSYTCDGEVGFTDISTNAPFGWEWDFGDGSFSVAQNPTHTYLNDGVYDVKLTASNLYGSDMITKTSLVVVNTANALISADCYPNTLSSCCDYGITKVIFNTINNTSLNASEGYMDFSCENQTVVSLETSYPITVVTGQDNPQDTKVWLDLDNNGIFDNDELLLEKYNSYSFTAAIFIPPTALLNTPIRMRVSSDEVGNSFGPCDDLFRGQAEDYTVIVNGANLITNNDSFDFILYPNPSNGFVTFDIGNTELDKINIYSLMGKKIVDYVISSSSTSINLDLNELKTGSYLVELIDSSGFRSVETLVIQ